MMKYLIFFACTIYLSGCNAKAKQREEFIGVWQSEDGATVTLEASGEVIVKKLDISKIFDQDSSYVSRKGQWVFSQDQYKNDVIEIKIGYGFDFRITGSGMFENRRPWRLYTFIGDPDEMERYIFNKK